MKARVGPLAYFISGIRELKGPQLRIGLAMDEQPELRRRVRTVVVGNCGKLLAGLVLMPAARVDDGLLDVVAIAPKGIIGWVAVAARVMTRRRSDHPRVEHWQGGTVTITAEGSQQALLDGDPVGDARVLRMRIDQGALLVRVPASAYRTALSPSVPEFCTGVLQGNERRSVTEKRSRDYRPIITLLAPIQRPA